ncbi:MAG: hypothetical protein K2V38_00940 [Gemmataceae bacterium]|nr:hypothetical protein [Gemmataceae bacterium]
MTKSPRAVAQEALPAYSSATHRKDFTQHQLFAILALKTFLKLDDRGVVAFLTDFTELWDDLGLVQVPSYSPHCNAEQRLLKGAFVALLYRATTSAADPG